MQNKKKNKNKKKLNEKLNNNNIELNKIFKNNFIDENKITLKILIYEEEQNLSEFAELIKNIFIKNPEFEIIINKVSYVNYIEKLFDKNDFDITLFYYNIKPGPFSYINLLKNNLSLINLNEERDIFSNKMKTLAEEIINETKTEKQKEKIIDLKNSLMNDFRYLKISSDNKYYIIDENLKNFKVNSNVEECLNLMTIESMFKTSRKK